MARTSGGFRMPRASLSKSGRQRSASLSRAYTFKTSLGFAVVVLPFAAVLIALLAFLPTSGRAGELDADFVILRKGTPIGFHRVEVEATPVGRIARTTIEMRVKFGPLPLFRYDHKSVEEWRHGKLHSIEAQTNHNGERSFMRAFRGEGALFVEGSGYKGAAPETAVDLLEPENRRKRFPYQHPDRRTHPRRGLRAWRDPIARRRIRGAFQADGNCSAQSLV